MNNNKLPKNGRSKDDIISALKEYGTQDPAYKDGRTWSLVYYLGEEHTSLLQDAYNMYFSANGLNPMAFKSLKQLESDIIRITADLLNGDENVCGVVTSGGTESCLLAVKTYRDYGKAKKRIKKPQMIIPETAHVAWEKGGEYFGVEILRAPLDKDYRVDVQAVKKMVTKNTIMILGSAPEYPHGIIDPIEELGQIASARVIPLHVDACVGGYILPFIEKLGTKLTPWDYRVPGVTSISADTHKYGFAAKGASTITYRSKDILKYQFFVYENWPGGIFASPALLGTRPGGSYAAAWAALQIIGEKGYLKITNKIMETTRKLINGINAIEGLHIIGNPKASLISYQSLSPEINIYAVGDEMEKRGWHIDRLQKPEALHAMVVPKHAEVVDTYLSDLEEAVEIVKQHPELSTQGDAAMYGMISNVPLRGVIRKQVLDIFTNLYGPENEMINLKNASITSSDKNDSNIRVLSKKLSEKLLNIYVRHKQTRAAKRTKN